MNTHFTGIAIHEWLGILFAGLMIYHILLHWDWIVSGALGSKNRVFSR